MLAVTERTDFTLRDPGALGALLVYDWRIRKLLTDEEVMDEAIDRPVSTGVLRHLQRLGFVRAVHGVRPQGGRMRLWPVAEVMRVQAALDLRSATGKRLSACVDALMAHASLLDDAVADWERHVGADEDPRAAALVGVSPASLLTDADALQRLVNASAKAFVSRGEFDGVSQPAFLL